MLLIVGVIPAFAVAAVIEGFVTGRTGTPILEVAVGAIVVVAYLTLLLFPTRAPVEAGGRKGVRAGPST